MTLSKARRVIGALLSVAAFAAACDSRSQPEPAGVVLTAVSGDAQVTLPSGQVPRPLVVRAIDSSGAPARDLLIHWAGTMGSKFVTDTTRTDSSGVARAVWTLGSTNTTYTASATAGSVAELSFTADADPASLIVTAVPDTVRLTAIGDTVTMMVRVRSTVPGQLDTLVHSLGWSGMVTSVAKPSYVGGNGMVLQAVKNGVESQWVYFGDIAIPIHVIVQQVATDVRITRAGSGLPSVDTVVMVPDSAQALAVTAVDKLGHALPNGAVESGVTWSSSNPSVATVTDGVVQGVAAGTSTITAHFDTTVRHIIARIWTLQASVISAGGATSCALVDEGSLACWGYREPGGNSALSVALAPEVRVGGPYSHVGIGESGGCVVLVSGSAKCWGRNTRGQIGNGTFGSTYIATPTEVSGGITWSKVFFGAARTCGLAVNGKAYCWGFSGLGTGNAGVDLCGPTGPSCTTTPAEVAGGHTFTHITSGSGAHACGIDTEGRAFCWGTNLYGQLGSPQVPCDSVTTNPCSRVPVEVSGNRRYKWLSAGVTHTCGVTIEGQLYCWGMNMAGVLGGAGLSEGTTPASVYAEPQLAAPTVSWLSVTASRQHTCGIDTSNAAWCWGSGFTGQLGTGSLPTQPCTNGPCEPTPVKVAGGLLFKQLSLGNTAHTCGLTTDDLMYCWGWGAVGSLGYGGTANHLAPVKVAFQKR